MTKFMAHIDHYIKGTATVMPVHHCGHLEQDRGRGSSVLPANIDVEYKVSSPHIGVCSFKNTKMKDAAVPPVMNFDMERVIIGEHDGVIVDSLVAKFKREGALGSDKKYRGQTEDCLQALRDLYKDHRERLKSGGLPQNSAKVLVEDWKAKCVPDIYGNQRSFTNTKNRLLTEGAITILVPHVYLNEAMECDC